MGKILHFFGSILVLLILFFLAYFYFSTNFNNSPEIEIPTPKEISLGEVFPITLNIKNNTNNIFYNVSIFINTEDGIDILNSEERDKIFNKKINNIGKGGFISENFNFITYSKEDSKEDIYRFINFDIEYSLENKVNSPRFHKKYSEAVLINNKPLNMEFSSEKESGEKSDIFTSGENMSFLLKYKNNSEENIENLKIRFDFPDSFIFKSSSKNDIKIQNNSYNIGSLQSTAEDFIKLKGYLTSNKEEDFSIKANIYKILDKKEFKIDEITLKGTIQPSLLSIKIDAPSLDDDFYYISSDTKKSSFSLVVEDEDKITFPLDLKIKLSGEALDLDNILLSNGTLDKNTKIISYSVNDYNKNPIKIDYSLKNNYYMKRYSDINPLITFEIEAGNKSSITKKKIDSKVEGDILLDSYLLYKDPENNILNDGAFPPRVGETTDLSFHLELKSPYTSFKNNKVQIELEKGVTLKKEVNKSKGDISTNSNIITWDIKDIVSGEGFITPSVNLILQLSITPDNSDIGQFKKVIKSIKFIGQDSWTNLSKEVNINTLDTNLERDKRIKEKGLISR